MIRALLIEDELPAREDLRALLASHPEVQIVGEAATVNNARVLLGRADYDLVFLDINLMGGSSFEVVPEVRPGARVIFTTAYDQFALRAFEVNALDYLLKPISAPRLAEALRRLAPKPPEPASAAPEEGERPLRVEDVVYLRAGQRACFVTLVEISAVFAQDNYSEVLLRSGERVLVRRTLANWEAILPPTHFFRAHRTHIVNLAEIQRYERDGEERTALFVAGAKEPLSASRRLWTELRDRLAALRPGF